MANRNAKLIKRIIQDFSLNVGGNGEPIEVATLPESGDPNAVYKTSDNKYWICTNTTETKTVSDLKVGQSYKMKEIITNKSLEECLHKFSTVDYSGTFDLDEEGEQGIEYDYAEPEEEGGYSSYYLNYFMILGRKKGTAGFDGDTSLDPDFELEIGFNRLEEIPTIEITQIFVEQLFEFSEGTITLDDFAFLFEGGSHEEEVTVSTWTELVPSEPSVNTTLTIQYGNGCGQLTVSLNGENLDIEELVKKRIYLINNVPEGSLLSCTYAKQNDEVGVFFNDELVVDYTYDSSVSFDVTTTGKDHLFINDYTNK